MNRLNNCICLLCFRRVVLFQILNHLKCLWEVWIVLKYVDRGISSVQSRLYPSCRLSKWLIQMTCRSYICFIIIIWQIKLPLAKNNQKCIFSSYSDYEGNRILIQPLKPFGHMCSIGSWLILFVFPQLILQYLQHNSDMHWTCA